MLSYPEGTFIPIAIATHGLVGLTLGLLLYERPWFGLFGGVVADGDFLFPGGLGEAFVHRSLTHSILVGAVVAGLAFAHHRRAGGAVAVTYASHLLIDATTPQGVQFFWPVVPEKMTLDVGVGGHAPEATLAFWVVCLGLLALSHSERPWPPIPVWD